MTQLNIPLLDFLYYWPPEIVEKFLEYELNFDGQFYWYSIK